MLPSKGYFKSLNCPSFEAGFCDRPYCLFRHYTRSRTTGTDSNDVVNRNNDEKILFGNTDEKDFVEEILNGPISEQNIVYKPTPISELNQVSTINNEFDQEKCFETNHFREEMMRHSHEVYESIFEKDLNGEDSPIDTHDLGNENCLKYSKLDTIHFYDIQTQNNKVTNSVQEKRNEAGLSKTTVSGLKKNHKRKNKIWESTNNNRRVNYSNSKSKMRVKSNALVSSSRDMDSYQKRICSREISGEPGYENPKSIQGKSEKSKLTSSSINKSNGCIVKRPNAESNLYSNKKSVTEIKQSIKHKTGHNISSNCDTKLAINITNSSSENVGEAKLAFEICNSKLQCHFRDETLILDNRVEGKRKIRIATGMVFREQKIRNKIKMMTPARRLLMQANQNNKEKSNYTCVLPSHSSTTMKIHSVPNVIGILQEKERLLKLIANNDFHVNTSGKQ